MKILVTLLALLLGLCFWSRPAYDPDLGWHLAGGMWIVEQLRSGASLAQALPQFDFVNSFGSRWHDYHWLGQILMYLLFEAGGYDLLFTFFALTSAYLLVLLTAIIRRNLISSPSDLAPLFLLLPTAYLLYDVASVRPQLLALVGLALTVRRLQESRSKGELPLLLLIAAVLANLHVYWIFIPFLWFCYRVLPRATDTLALTPLYSWGGVFLLGGAGLISPYGLFQSPLTLSAALSNYALIWDYAALPAYFRETISEFQGPLSRLNFLTLIILSWFALVARAVTLESVRRELGRWSSGATSFFLALRAVKFLSIFSVCGLPLAAQLADRTLSRFRLPTAAARVIIIGALALTTYYAWRTSPAHTPIQDRFLGYLPTEACAAIAGYRPKTLPHGHLRVLTHFNHGGWCRWSMLQAAPERDLRVTTDGRTQGLDETRFKQSADLFALREGWVGTLDGWAPNAILAGREHPLAHMLFLMPLRWRVLYQDNDFAVFVDAST